MSDNPNAELYRQVGARYSLFAQMDLLQEECAELIVAVSHWRRLRLNSIEELVGELADVQIMCEQAELFLDLEARVAAAKEAKLCRLRERLAGKGAQ